ncbi:hypothetical protein SDRG_03978 [Saprolegnia diclina VS20]|uniref:Uncharacterized protein n=1 Tax=Saprolegnia diclina (strain VS20) TaxID=1156394 RepID=T0QWI7_SAPDV|nr:hypothetical protein SDRG_03978 [Saprolegnia diclina VS20]EQC39026.1 hypothetical protein SDRG_03978 [Saprolegnia diclina VS20]|eukprot:XP_008607850.1 hypothetical protein SDRG_03978 [Saprolegnia diclina VS20]
MSCSCVRSVPALDWTSECCTPPVPGTWSCCGLDSYHHLGLGLLWALFLSLSVTAHVRHDLLHDFHRSAHDLHDIQAQALGVVVARRQRVYFGLCDARRGLQLGAMWLELLGFSAGPLQLLLPNEQLGAFFRLGQTNGTLQLTAFLTVIGLLILCAVASWRQYGRLEKLCAPFVFDLCYMTFMYTTMNVVGCTGGIDTIALGSHLTTCASPSRYYLVLGVGLLVFASLYYGALVYKKRLTTDVYAVRFRFQASFDTLMVMTLCGLTILTLEKSVLLVDANVVALFFGSLNLMLFGSLLRYNYVCQPCLGVGYVPNNVRALSFATSCYTTVLLLLVSAQAEGSINRHIAVVAIVLYPLYALGIWRWNGKRAARYHVPNLSVFDGLSHESDRVRAITAVTVTLQGRALDIDTVRSLLFALTAIVRRPTTPKTYAPVYACQALWFLWRHYLDKVSLVEATTGPLVASRLWALLLTRSSAPDSSIRAQSSGRRLSTIRLGAIASVPILIQLVETSVVARRARRAIDRISTRDPLVMACLERTVASLCALATSPSVDIRFIASKVLHEMYVAGVVRLGVRTFFRVAVALTVSPARAKAFTAATTLAAFASHRSDIWVALTATEDAVTLSTLVDALILHDDVTFRTELLPLVARIVHSLANMGTMAPRPSQYITQAVAKGLLQLQAAADETLLAQLDDVLDALLLCWDAHKPVAPAQRFTRIRPETSFGRTSDAWRHTPLVSLPQRQALQRRQDARRRNRVQPSDGRRRDVSTAWRDAAPSQARDATV